ncbi:M16 family metallopeptidase [Portibacter marinus]|uniref:M16 family metallopeptidase n=1 Tax=Portibacter marinus TaxID=2898660 RepID=UPI001F23C44B|nr:pitrilysin family protein [Portibacter marinus]
MKVLTTILAVLLLSISTNILHAQELQLPDGVTAGPSVEGISEYNLENGLKVLLFPDQSKPTITVNVTYMVGSRHEAYGETGMAHLLEHLVFKGTPDHPDIPAELTEHGARPNGTTWWDRTNYFETFNATDENLKWALDMESDRMVNSFISGEDLESEMTVVRNEFEAGENSPAGVLLKRVLGAAFQWHNYGKSTIGARADIENVPIERLQDFYRKYYQPDNAILLIAGKFDPQSTLELVVDYFGDIPKPERKIYPTYTKEPTQDGERTVVLKRSGDVQAVSVAYHTPPGPHSDYAALSVLDAILTDEPSGRLYKALVETKKAPYVWSFAPALKEGSFIYINADVRKENSIDSAQNIMLKTLDELTTKPPTEDEIERAKSKILKNWNLAYNSSDRVGLQMSEWIAQGDWRLFFLYRDRVENVSVDDVVRVAQKYIVPSNRTVGRFIPTQDPVRAEIPDAPPVEDIVANYEGKGEISEGEAFEPSPSNIDSRTKTGKLSSGAEYTLLSKENRGDGVNAVITLRFGTPNSLKGKSTIGDLTASMLDKGTESMSRQEIQDKFDELKARVFVYGSKNQASARIETTNENLSEVLAIVNDIFKNPSFTKEEFEKLKEEQLAGLEEQLSEPQAIANNVFSRALNPYPESDVRYVMTMEEQIEAIKAAELEEIVAFHDDFYGASEATISIVGDFNEEEIMEDIEKYFGDWENDEKYVRIGDPYKANKVASEEINTPDKANAMFFAGMNIPVGDDHADYPALLIGNYILGGGFLNSRLATRIRQQDGLSYGVGSFLQASSQDESGLFGAYAISAPENSEKVMAAFKEEVQKAIDEGFTAEELESARGGWIQGQSVSRSQDRELVGKLANNLRTDRQMKWSQELEDQIMALSVEEVNNAIARHIDVDKMVYVRAGDFEKVKKNIKP